MPLTNDLKVETKLIKEPDLTQMKYHTHIGNFPFVNFLWALHSKIDFLNIGSRV